MTDKIGNTVLVVISDMEWFALFINMAGSLISQCDGESVVEKSHFPKASREGFKREICRLEYFFRGPEPHRCARLG